MTVFTLILLSLGVSAQSSLFNIPTAEVLQDGETYIEADFDAHIASFRNGGFRSFGFTAVRGVGKRFEIGLNGASVQDADGVHAFEFQPNVKFKAYENESIGISVAAGAVAYLPASRRIGSDGLLNAYVMARKEFKNARAPVVTAGAYQLAGSDKDRGLMFGIEQPIAKRVTFISDWTTGRNRFGYAAAGLGISLTKRSALYTAYYFGNAGRGNNSVGVYYGYSF